MLTPLQISQTEATLTKSEGASTFRWLPNTNDLPDVEAYDSQGNYLDTYHITLNDGRLWIQ